MVKITKDIKAAVVDISPFEMGQEFASMFDDEQADFFSGVASITSTWPMSSCFQWDYMRRQLNTRPDALKVFKEMSEYGYD